MAVLKALSSLLSRGTGGYNYTFVDKVPERLICQICAKPFRDPHLVVCCGKHYCGSCLTEWFTKAAGSHESCPHCRAKGKKFSHVVHKGLKSEVDELKMYCPNRKEGCKWIGQLGDYETHRTSQNGCNYESVACPNKCRDPKWETFPVTNYFCRKDIKNHLTYHCVNRQYLCKYCLKLDTYEKITKSHYNECPEHPISCPNLRCSVTDIKRKELSDHLKKCPEELIDCPFAEAGCKERVRRGQMGDHMTSSVQLHLVTLMEAYKEVKGAYKEVKRRLEDLESSSKPTPKKFKFSARF